MEIEDYQAARERILRIVADAYRPRPVEARPPPPPLVAGWPLGVQGRGRLPAWERREATRRLIELGRTRASLSHTKDGIPYARLRIGKRTKSISLRSSLAVRWLRKLYRDEYHATVPKPLLLQVLEVLAGFAHMAPMVGGRHRILGLGEHNKCL